MSLPTKKKRRPSLYISIACFLIIGLATVFIAFSNYNFSSVGQIIADAKDPSSNITTTELEAPIHNMQLFSETYEDTNTTYSIQYPQIEDEAFNTMISQYINSEKELFLALADEAPAEELKNFTATVEASSLNDRFYSITFHTTTDVTNGPEKKQVSTFVYDTEIDEFITLQQLLHDHTRYLQTFSNFVYEQLKNNTEIQANLVDDQTLQEVVTPLWDSYPNFAIDNNELVIYFEPGAVASYETGIVTVRAELAYLYPILAKTFKKGVTPATATIPLFTDNKKRVALTFDDGPHKSVTNEILTILDEFDAKATFFMLGRNIEKYPEIAQDVHNNGHEIGNHTWTHPILTKLSLDEVKTEYERTEQVIVDTIGEHSTVFRPPFGATNDEIKELIPQQSVNWSLDTLDWKHRNPHQTLQILKSTMHNNAVVLMHDIHQPTADSLRAVLQYLQDEGYEFLTLSELMPYVDYNM